MDQVVLKDILNAIKSDDLVSFATLIKGKTNLCYGRFPLLTLCYMYGARKIAKHYFDLLCKIKIYEIVSEPFEVYKKFKSIAGRCLRFFTKDKAVVSPAEMLAILHQDSKLKRKFKNFVITDAATKNLNKIYGIYGQKIEIKEDKIKIRYPKLNRNQKIACVLGIVLGFVMSLSVMGGYGLSIYTLGLGTENSPYKISSESRFYQALKSTSGTYILTRDIEIENFNDALEFSGNFDGNNHTIFINKLPKESFISKNNGTIKNLNIVYSDIDAETNNNLSLFVGENTGSISNVNVSCNDIDVDFIKSSEKNLFFGAIAIINNGTIENCQVKLNATLIGTGDGECFAGGLVATNNKNIKNCVFEDGYIVTDTIDVAGLVAVNNALIEDSINNADIKQVSGVNNWSPNAGGICVVNNASIKHVVNSGKISVVSTLEGDDIGGTVYVSGISVINCGEIQKSLNKGEINATSKEIMVFAGGISASSEFTTSGMQQILPVINECGNQGDVNVVTQDERAYVFAGGISGFVYGIVKNSYSTADFEKEYAEGKYFVGTFLGAVDVDYYGGAYVAIEEIYVKELENPSFHVGASFLSSYDIDGVLVNRSIYGLGFDFNAHVNVESLEELVLQEVYWNE